MNLENNIKKNIDIKKAANNILDFGLRSILPDFIENDIIEIKEAFINEGFSEGLEEILKKLKATEKIFNGILTGEFESIEDIKKLIQSDGILDNLSKLIDKILKILKDNKIINKTTYNLIKTGKKELISSLKADLKDKYTEDTFSMEKLESYCTEWKEFYNNGDLDGMKKTMTKITKKLNDSKLVEETINEAREIEKIQKLINKKGGIEGLSEKEKTLIEKLN